MSEKSVRLGSFVLLLGLVQFFLLESISTFLYPGYSIANNFVSDLGTGANTAIIFNSSIVVLGITEIVGGYMLRSYSRFIFVTFTIAGIGAAGVGVVNQDLVYSIHMIFALLAFLFASVSSYVSLYKERNATGVLWAVLGSISLAALFLSYPYFDSFYFGIGSGGMERMTMIPNILWAIGFTASLYNKHTENNR